MISVRFHLRSEAKNLSGFAPMSIRLSRSGKRIVIPLGIAVQIANWNQRRQLVVKGEDRASLNIRLEKERGRVLNIIHQDENQSLREIKRKYLRRVGSQDNLIPWAKQWLIRRRDLGAIVDSSLRIYLSYLRMIEKYSPEVKFKELNQNWFDGLMEWYKENGQPLKSGQAGKKNLIALVKILQNGAKIEGLYSGNIVRTPKITLPSKIIFLDENEVKALDKYFQDTFGHRKRILRPFLFCCFTGLRWSDAAKLRWHQIQDGAVRIIPQKTRKKNRYIYVPLKQQAIDYLPERGHPDDLVFYLPNHSDTGYYLSLINKEIEIEKKITFHVSRHTFATNFLRLGGNVLTLQKILGHSSIDMTIRYSHIQDKDIDREMQVWDNW